MAGDKCPTVRPGRRRAALVGTELWSELGNDWGSVSTGRGRGSSQGG
jgi:hypothetical protein